MPLGAGSIMKVTNSAVIDGADIVNHVFHARISNVPTASDQQIIDAIRDHMNTAYAPLNTSMALGLVGSETTVAESISPNVFVEAGTAPLTGVLGAGTGERLPTFAAATVLFGVQNQGRKGRKSFWPMTVSQVDGNIINSGTISNLITWGLNFTGTINLGVVQVVFGIYKPDTGTLADLSGTVTVNSILGTMVTRKIGRGQ